MRMRIGSLAGLAGGAVETVPFGEPIGPVPPAASSLSPGQS
jgi:hypothetical protein